MRQTTQTIRVKRMLASCLAALAGVPGAAAQATAPASGSRGPAPLGRPKNVLVIVVDQWNVRVLGHEDNGFGGVSTSLTPNLDRLAQEGVRFQNASCATAVCQSSRVTLLTGMWPHDHGVRQNLVWEPRTLTTFPALARAAGYATASIGKHHLMWTAQPPGTRDDHGFDQVTDFGDYLDWCAANGLGSYDLPANVVAMPGLPAPLAQTGWTTNPNAFHPAGYWADQVSSFLEDRAGPQGDGRPFVCWYSMFGPHTPILPSGVPPDDYAHLYQPWTGLSLPPNLGKNATTQRLAGQQAQYAAMTASQHRQVLSYYYGLVTQIDANIGRVLQRLDELGLADETLVVFTADHGEMASEMSTWTKGTGSYDALTRVPLLMRLPGVLPAGGVLSEPVNLVDLAPTLLEVTGVPISDADRAALDGSSLLQLASSGSAPPGWPQETFHEIGNTTSNRQFMVRTPAYKYVRDEIDGAEELYDLGADPFEITNRIADPDPVIQAQVADLRARFEAWWNDGLGHAPFYAKSGLAGALPAPAAAPSPADGGVGVKRDVDPTWLPSTAAAAQQVWLGTSPTALALFATLGAMETRFNPGSLAPATTYWWRVDGTNANGTTIGPLWSFTTQASGPGGPGLAKAPLPAHGSSGVPATSALAWTPGTGASTQAVWFGPAGAAVPVATGLAGSVSTFDPGPLQAGLAYEWRVDGTDAAGTTTGDLWRFTVSPAGLPARALPLEPRHLDPAAPPGTRLRWTPVPGADSYDVHFGSGFPLPWRGNQSGTSWDPGPLVPGSVYYWRIDTVGSAGTRVGFTWRFVAG